MALRALAARPVYQGSFQVVLSFKCDSGLRCL
jgi:hypothetical protein